MRAREAGGCGIGNAEARRARRSPEVNAQIIFCHESFPLLSFSLPFLLTSLYFVTSIKYGPAVSNTGG